MDDELRSAPIAFLQYRKEMGKEFSETEGLFKSYCEYVLSGQSRF